MKKLLLMISLIAASSAVYPAAGKVASILSAMGSARAKIGAKAAYIRQVYGPLAGPSIFGGGLFAAGEVYGKGLLGTENELEQPLHDLKDAMNVQQADIKAQQADIMNKVNASNAALMALVGMFGVSVAQPTTWYGQAWYNSKKFFDGSKSVLGDIAHAIQLLQCMIMIATISKSAYAYAKSGAEDAIEAPAVAAAVAPTPVIQKQPKPVAAKPVMKRRR